MEKYADKLLVIGIATSPVIWVVVIVLAIFWLLNKIWIYVGIGDFYFVYFEFKKNYKGKNAQDILTLSKMKANVSKTMYSKWRYTKCANKIESIIIENSNGTDEG